MAGAGPRVFLRLVEGPVDLDWVREQVAGPDAGCVVRFEGTVRQEARGKAVLRLEYEAYPPMVEAELGRICGEILERHAVLRIAVEHATGRVDPGQASVAVAVASAHRAPAFAAAAELMDLLKERVPLWKQEFYPDGSSWIGRGS